MLSRISLILLIRLSLQEMCTPPLEPFMVDLVNVSHVPREIHSSCQSNCSLQQPQSSLTNFSGPSGNSFLGWKTPGAIDITFQSPIISHITGIMVTLWYKNDTECGFPSISFSHSLPGIESPAVHCDRICNVSSNGNVSDLSSLRISFGFPPEIEQFCLIKVAVSCGSSPSSSTFPTSGSTLPTDDDNTTLVIISSASVLGFLLVMVILMLFTLICIVLLKKKPSHQYNITQARERNMYEPSPQKGEQQSKKYFEESMMPQLPSDPEYATISEHRQMAGLPPPSVTNPFYATSAMAMPGGSNLSELPEYTQVVETCSQPPGGILERSYTAHSLQDVRGLIRNEEQGLKTSSTKSPGMISRRAQTLTRSCNSHSTHNIPMQMMTNSNSMKPAPPPRSPTAIQRRASQKSLQGEPYLVRPSPEIQRRASQKSLQGEPYLARQQPPQPPTIQRRGSQKSLHGEPYLAGHPSPLLRRASERSVQGGEPYLSQLQSPLTQSIRALKGHHRNNIQGDSKQDGGLAGSEDEDDVDADNYIKIP